MGVPRLGTPITYDQLVQRATLLPLRVYVAILSVVWAFILFQATTASHIKLVDLGFFLILGGLFLGTELADVYFYDSKGGRWGLSTCEAVLAPMVVVLPVALVIVAVTVAVALERIHRRLSPLKIIFNSASYGCAAAGSCAVWVGLQDGSGRFTVVNALVLVASVVVFALLTHFFASVAIAAAEGRGVASVSFTVASTTILNLIGTIAVGMFFSAAVFAATWTVVLFPFAMAGLFLANRAVMRQSRERLRVGHLHAATRALVAGGDLRNALLSFLREVRQIASADEARAIVRVDSTWVWSGVRSSETVADLEPVDEGPLLALMHQVAEGSDALVVTEDDGSLLAARMGVKGFIAVPIREEEQTVGCLIVSQRVGAGDFDAAEAQLVEALAGELSVSLGAYRLFSEVAEERERFGRIFSSSQEGICLLDADGVVRAWNPALEKISGHYAADLMDHIWSDRVLIRDREQRRLTKLDLVRVRPADEVELVTKEGPSRWVTMVSGPVGETEGGGWVVLIRDVTAAHEVEVAKSDFLSTISHELRTPLTTIKGSLQVLGRGRDNLPDKIADQMIDVTTRGAERLERLVMNLLAVSQIESGSIAVFPDEISLEDVVRDRYQALLSGHPRARLTVPENPISVRADRERMAQTVEHLFENALKFGGPDGEIKVSISHHKGYARLSVSDDGPGIASADQERIFDRFVRLGEVLTRETQGAGIGLFIAKSAVDAMGGRIWVESTPGKGATFHVEVPLARPMVLAEEGSA